LSPAPLDAATLTALEKLGFGGHRVDAAVVLGSGFDGCADLAKPLVEAEYAAIPGLGSCTVAGHRGLLSLGRLGKLKVLLFRGRRHFYESGHMGLAALPVRVAAHLGARLILSISAVGGLTRELGVGSWVFVDDHINLMGTNPLLGVRDPDGPPFVDLTRTYRRDLFASINLKLPAANLKRGVLAAFSGPTYETPAEVRMAAFLGASVVGMSTVPEAVWARYLGLDMVAFGRVVNPAAGLTGAPVSHLEVLKEAGGAVEEAIKIVGATLDAWSESRDGY